MEALDESAWKVYSLAQSLLFRLAHQPKNAGNVLEKLVAKYPKDSDVHLQLARLRMLEGKTKLAYDHFGKARSQSIGSLAAKLFQTAIGERTSDIGSVMPEEEGLANCNRAMWAIKANDFRLARDVVNGPFYVDKLHRDFGAVLGYHAMKAMDSNYDYRSDQVLCRIMKRGFKEIRQAAVAISEGSFDIAQKHELTACLLIG